MIESAGLSRKEHLIQVSGMKREGYYELLDAKCILVIVSLFYRNAPNDCISSVIF